MSAIGWNVIWCRTVFRKEDVRNQKSEVRRKEKEEREDMGHAGLKSGVNGNKDDIKTCGVRPHPTRVKWCDTSHPT